MPNAFAIPGGYMQKSFVRQGRYYWKNYEGDDSGYVGRIRARFLWCHLGKPEN
jgi:hypothetical protein